MQNIDFFIYHIYGYWVPFKSEQQKLFSVINNIDVTSKITLPHCTDSCPFIGTSAENEVCSVIAQNQEGLYLSI